MKKNSYSYNELIKCGKGGLFGPGNAKLPLPPMLMFDRITEINDKDGAFKKGSLKAELDINKDLWFFDCHNDLIEEVNIKKNITGKKINSVEVLIKVASDNQNQN